MNKLHGIIFVLLATICYASLTPLLKKASQQLQPFTMIAISMFVLFLNSLIFSMIFENSLKLKIGDHKNTILILILVGVINTIGFWFLIKVFKYMSIGEQELFRLLTPVFAGIFAYFILGEPLSSKLFLGLSIMAIGLFIAVR